MTRVVKSASESNSAAPLSLQGASKQVLLLLLGSVTPGKKRPVHQLLFQSGVGDLSALGM